MTFLTPISKKALPIFYEWHELTKTKSGSKLAEFWNIYPSYFGYISYNSPKVFLESYSNSKNPSESPWQIIWRILGFESLIMLFKDYFDAISDLITIEGLLALFIMMQVLWGPCLSSRFLTWSPLLGE